MTEDTKEKPGFYAIIPAAVRYCKDLEPNAKLLYGEITALCNSHGYCWASNKYFTSLYEVDERTIRRWLESLSNNGFINVEHSKDGFMSQRRIYLCISFQNISTTGQNCPPERTLMPGGADKNARHNNTSNTTYNKSSSSLPPPKTMTPQIPNQGKEGGFSMQMEREVKQAAPPEKKIYPCLESLDIPHQDKVRLTETYLESTISASVKFCTHPEFKPNRGLVNAVFHYSSKPEQMQPRKEDIKQQQIQMQYDKQEIMAYNKMLAEEASKNLWPLCKENGTRIHSNFPDYVLTQTGDDRVKEKAYYGDKNFLNDFTHHIRKADLPIPQILKG